MDYILSIDAGTTAFKTSLFDENGRLLGISTREYELLTPTALAVELPAEEAVDGQGDLAQGLEVRRADPFDVLL